VKYLIRSPFPRGRFNGADLLSRDTAFYEVSEVSLRALRSTQASVDLDLVMKIKCEKNMVPSIRVLWHRNRFFIMDGHHRATAALFQGKKKIFARVERFAEKRPV
jgi:hypothetical protein